MKGSFLSQKALTPQQSTEHISFEKLLKHPPLLTCD